jgi:hypothetical protein
MPEPLPAAPEELLPEPLPETRPGPSAAPAPLEPELPPSAPEQPLLQPRITPGTSPASPESIERATRAVESNDIEAALRELGGGAQPVPPSGAPEGNPSPSVVPRFAAMSVDQSVADVAATLPRVKWIYRDGRWVRAPQPAPAAPAKGATTTQAGLEPPPQEPNAEARPLEGIASRPATGPAQAARGEDPFGWRKASKSDMARIIAISLQKLNDGDPRQNVVVRDNDIIHVPYLPVGEFYVTGEVLRPGVYALPSTPVTIKQALSAAGNVGPLAWPENSVLIRRLGSNQEQIIPVNVEAIFRGDEPDLFLKPNDIIAVGTDVRAPFFAVLRNAFRMTYGFGFIYDRNFSDPMLLTPKSNRFTRL